MARLLNLSLSGLLVGAIRFYQRFISKRISRNCIYEKTCSHRAVEILNSKASLFFKYQKIKTQISGCKIVEIISTEGNSWNAVNGNGELLSPTDLNEHTRLDIHFTLKPFKN